MQTLNAAPPRCRTAAYQQRAVIEKLIVTVRGEQVLIDQDIAKIYGVTTGRLNEQAKRNIARFPESFRFQLTKEERDEVIANCENLRSLKFYPSMPYAYTEQGIGQLSTVVSRGTGTWVITAVIPKYLSQRLSRSNLSKTKNIPPKTMIFSDFMLTFAMSLIILLVLICSTKVSEKSDMAKS